MPGSPSHAGAGSRLARLLRARGEARKQTALRLATTALRNLRKEGISARLVGSLVKGTFRADSDVDFLIEDRGGRSESRVTGLIERSMSGFPFDVVFADRADPELLKFMRDEARGGAPAVRRALKLGKRDKIRCLVQRDGRVVMTRRAPAEDDDPALENFLQFIARDIVAHPERIRALGRHRAARIRALVKGVTVDLGSTLRPEKE